MIYKYQVGTAGLLNQTRRWDVLKSIIETSDNKDAFEWLVDQDIMHHYEWLESAPRHDIDIYIYPYSHAIVYFVVCFERAQDAAAFVLISQETIPYRHLEF